MRSWRANRWRSQARTLWQRYRDVAELGDEHEVYARLKEFLDSFRTQYQEVSAMGDNSETMDRLYGDCTEVLHSLLDYVHRELKLPAAADAAGGEGSSGAGALAAAEYPAAQLSHRICPAAAQRQPPPPPQHWRQHPGNAARHWSVIRRAPAGCPSR